NTMLAPDPLQRVVVISLVLVLLTVPMALGESPADKLYRAYYFEREKGDCGAAAKLYAEVAAAKDAPGDVQAMAKVRLVACQEEIATADLARLMPPEPLAYVELSRPGERVRKLLDQLGLLARPGQPPPAPGENRLAISPALVDAIFGLRGAAVAVTGLDPANHRPAGVAVLHPGDMTVVRGLLETGLPAAAEVIQPIGGFPTYRVEEAYVTLTARLVVAGTSPAEIESLLSRLKGTEPESLATNARLQDVLKDRRGELLFLCVNPQPLMPLVDALMMTGAGRSREGMLAHALLDPKSLQAVTGRLDVSDQGLAFELTLRLDEGHRNLVYNFLRRPAIDMAALRCVPAGAAGFLTLAMNPAPPQYADTAARPAGELPVVTALDIGRELFANINGVAIYFLPPAGAGAKGGIPDIGATITVNDPAKSDALWSQLLGLASLAAGGPTMEGAQRQVAGAAVRSYDFEKFSVHATTVGHHLLITSTDSAMTRALEAKRSGKSIVDDAGFAPLMARIGPHTTVALLAHAGRCAELARPFIPPGEAAELEPVIALLANTTAAVTIDHSDRMLRLGAGVNGVPDVSGLVNARLTLEQRRRRTQGELTQVMRAGNWEAAHKLLDEQLAARPGEPGLLRKKFDALAAQGGVPEAAKAAGAELNRAIWNDAQALNSFAWELLTEKKYGGRFSELALEAAQRCNELTGNAQWAYVDTLALAEFETGNRARAIELEEKAITLSKTRAGGAGLAEMERALKRFRQAAKQGESTGQAAQAAEVEPDSE
ncbi:MAG: hypothetical protein AB1716_13245, partial [Planctomycetota bacterium]